jgi:hypothetical protein
MEDFRRDRTQTPTVCNRELRTVCCPVKYLPTLQQTTVTEKIVSRLEVDEDGPDESEPFIASQIDKSKFMSSK